MLRPSELQWFYQEGASRLYPDAWEKYVAPIAPEDREDFISAYYRILTSDNEELKIKAKTNAKFLVISGKPINEEIARGGPFVMNTKAEILQAVQDYHNGTFVK